MFVTIFVFVRGNLLQATTEHGGDLDNFQRNRLFFAAELRLVNPGRIRCESRRLHRERVGT